MSEEKQTEVQKQIMLTIMETLENSRRVEGSLKDSVETTCAKMKDSYGNIITALGNDDAIKEFDSYSFSTDTLNWPLWMSLYNDSWVFRRAIDKPAEDEVRCGITLRGKDENDKFKIVQKKMNSLSSDLIELLAWGALFGGAVGCILLDNVKDEEYAYAPTEQKIKSAKQLRLYVTDRWIGCVPSEKTVTNMADPDFGKPDSYRIQFANGKEVTMHHKWVLRYEHRKAPRFAKSILNGWGYAEGSHIINELMRDDQLKSSIQSLVNKALIEVINMPGMRGLFLGQDEDTNSQITQRVEMVNRYRSSNSLTFLDSEDEYHQNEFHGLTGLSEILQQNMWMIASALEMQGILFGDLKGGFSADEHALERYDETIHNRLERYARPIYEKLLGFIYKMNGIEEPVDFDFNSIIGGKEEKEKVENIKTYVELLSNLLSDEVIDPSQYAECLKNYTEHGIINLGFAEDKIQELKMKKEEAEDFDIESEDYDKKETSVRGVVNI